MVVCLNGSSSDNVSHRQVPTCNCVKELILFNVGRETRNSDSQINVKIKDSQTEKFRRLVHTQSCKLCAFAKTKDNFVF